MADSFGIRLNRGVNHVAEAFCKLTTDSFESFINLLRGIRSNGRFFIEVQKHTLLVPIPFLSIAKEISVVAKPVLSVVDSGIHLLTFVEFPYRVKKLCTSINEWNKPNAKDYAVYKVISTSIQVLQKGLETFLIIPNTWNWINLAKLCAEVSSKTGLTFVTSTFVVGAKDMCVIVSSVFGIIYATKDIADQEKIIRKKKLSLDANEKKNR